LKIRWLLFLALPLLVLAVSLQPFARAQTKKLLGGLKGASAEFNDVRVSIFPLRYRIQHLKLRERNAKTKEPLFYADELAATLRWARLLTGRLAGTVEGRAVKVVLHQPDEGSDARLPPVEELIPFRADLERAQIKDAEVLYVWVREKNRPSVWFHGIEATLENVGSRPGMVKGPMVLSARGKVQRSGTMTAFVTADPYATPLNFAGTVKISGFDPSQMNSLIESTKGVKLTPGRFDMEMAFECRNGRLRGWIEPRLSGTEITSADEKLGSGLKALISKISMSAAAPTEGTEPSGRIKIEDDLADPKLQFWPTVEKVVENGFLLGLQEGLKRNTGPEKRTDPANQKPTELKVTK
jgi:hypothetical protein